MEEKTRISPFASEVLKKVESWLIMLSFGVVSASTNVTEVMVVGAVSRTCVIRCSWWANFCAWSMCDVKS